MAAFRQACGKLEITVFAQDKLANFPQKFSLFAAFPMYTLTHIHPCLHTDAYATAQFLKLHIFADLYA